MIKEIITDYDKLSCRSEEVDVKKDNAEVRQIVLDLKHTCAEHNLASLSAPQIGVFKRLLVINFNGELRTFINPIITSIKGFELSKEDDPCIPGKTYIIPRYNDIDVMYQTPLGKVESKTFKGLVAKVMLQQVDHLDGLIISDVGLEVDDDFFNATEEERQEVISYYLESLDIKVKDIKEEIDADPELKQLSDGIDFIRAVAAGEVELGEKVTVEKEIEPETEEKPEDSESTEAAEPTSENA